MARTKQTARKTLVGSVASKRPRQRAVVSAQNESESEAIQNFVNTQQFSLKFDDQDKCEQKVQQNELIACQSCSAFYTCQSKSLTNKEYKQLKDNPKLSDTERQKYLDNYENAWICEFCLTHNSIPFSYKVPKQQNPCVILQKNNIKKQKEQNKQKILIFCIDISGSMDMSFEGKTRLESVKQAILDEVNRLKYEKQKIKVGLVTFGNQVNLIGDGHAFKQSVLPTQLYKNFDGVINYLQKINNFCYPLQKSFNDIKKTISGLSVHGSTALGPGLLSAVQLSSKGSVGSKIILCTDGEANVGMGGCFSDDKTTFYERVAQHAKKRNVMVNILSLKGDKCNLKQLGKLSLATGGSILKIDPKLLGTQFKKIVRENVIGTQSKIVVKLNRLFRICNGKIDEISADRTTLTQDFGNFTEDTQLNFQFDVVDKQEAQKLTHIDMGLYQCKKVPMQVQLTYVGRNNWKYLQIVTDWRELTHNLEDIYEGANFSLFAASVLQRASTKIRDKQFREAQTIISGYWSLVTQRFSKTQPEAQLNRFAQRIKKIEKILSSKAIKSGNQGVLVGRGKSAKRRTGVSGFRGRGRGNVSMKRQRSLSRDKKKRKKDQSEEQQSQMSSDSEERILYKQIRARERSRSRQRSRSRSQSPKGRKNLKSEKVDVRSRDKKSRK